MPPLAMLSLKALKFRMPLRCSDSLEKCIIEIIPSLRTTSVKGNSFHSYERSRIFDGGLQVAGEGSGRDLAKSCADAIRHCAGTGPYRSRDRPKRKQEKIVKERRGSGNESPYRRRWNCLFSLPAFTVSHHTLSGYQPCHSQPRN